MVRLAILAPDVNMPVTRGNIVHLAVCDNLVEMKDIIA